MVRRGNLKTLGGFFKVNNENDIELVMPLIKESFYMTKPLASDIKWLNKYCVEKILTFLKKNSILA